MLRAASCLLVLFAGSAPALAHRGHVHRRMLLEPSAGEVLQVVVHIEVSGRARRQAWIAIADADRDGRLSERERDTLSRALSERALDGIVLSIGAATASIAGARSKLVTSASKGPAEGAIQLMLHGVAHLPDAVNELSVRVSSGDPLELEALRGTRPVIRAGRGRLRGGGLAAVVARGGDLAWRIRDSPR